MMQQNRLILICFYINGLLPYINIIDNKKTSNTNFHKLSYSICSSGIKHNKTTFILKICG